MQATALSCSPLVCLESALARREGCEQLRHHKWCEETRGAHREARDRVAPLVLTRTEAHTLIGVDGRPIQSLETGCTTRFCPLKDAAVALERLAKRARLGLRISDPFA